jgi:hypothetical protein
VFAGGCAVLVAIVIPLFFSIDICKQRKVQTVGVYHIIAFCPDAESVVASELGAVHHFLSGSAIWCFHIWVLRKLGGGSQKGDDHHHGNRPHKPFKVLHATNTSKLLVLFLAPNAFDVVFDHLLRISQGLLTLGLRLFLKGIEAILQAGDFAVNIFSRGVAVQRLV